MIKTFLSNRWITHSIRCVLLCGLMCFMTSCTSSAYAVSDSSVNAYNDRVEALYDAVHYKQRAAIIEKMDDVFIKQRYLNLVHFWARLQTAFEQKDFTMLLDLVQYPIKIIKPDASFYFIHNKDDLLAHEDVLFNDPHLMRSLLDTGMVDILFHDEIRGISDASQAIFITEDRRQGPYWMDHIVDGRTFLEKPPADDCGCTAKRWLKTTDLRVYEIRLSE